MAKMQERTINLKLLWAIQLVCKKVMKFPIKPIEYKALTPIAPLSLAALLGLGGTSWLVQSAIAPSVAQAYTARIEVAINREGGESYQTLLRRSEALARAAAQRGFDQDILVTDVAVMVLAQNEGAIAPVLSLIVTRQEWKSRPDPQRWAKYYTTAQSLLRMDDNASVPLSGQPGTPTVPAPSPEGTPTNQPGTSTPSPRPGGRSTPQQPGGAPTNQPGTPATPQQEGTPANQPGTSTPSQSGGTPTNQPGTSTPSQSGGTPTNQPGTSTPQPPVDLPTNRPASPDPNNVSPIPQQPGTIPTTPQSPSPTTSGAQPQILPLPVPTNPGTGTNQ